MLQRNYPEILRAAAKQNVKEREFWLHQLSGDIVKTGFPFDMKNPKANEFIINSSVFQLPGTQEKELYSKLMELSKGSHYTLNLVLISTVTLLLGRYTGHRDILVGTPIHKQQVEGDFINTSLILRNRIENSKTFREFLLQVRQTIKEINENRNFPLNVLIEELFGNAADSGYPFDVAVLLENIHEKKYMRDVRCNVTFSFLKKEECIEGVLEYNAGMYTKTAAGQMITLFINLLRNALSNIDLPLSHLEIMTEEEKNRVLYDFNRTPSEYPADKTVHQLFEEQAVRTPESIAAASPVDLNDIFQPTSCFRKNSYTFQSRLEYPGTPFILLKTHYQNCIVVNRNTLKLIERFDGRDNIDSIFSCFNDLSGIKFIIYNVEMGDLLEITHDFNREGEIFSNMAFDDFVRLVKLLHQNHLIRFAAVKPRENAGKPMGPGDFDPGESVDESLGLNDLFFQHGQLPRAHVLLLGDTPGMPSVGLLYIASYLKRNGVNALCRFYDGAAGYQSMKTEIEGFLEQVRPGVVAVSLKWFLYIARVMDICKIVKEYADKNGVSINVVVGGNTAAYYWNDIIKNEYIDCVIRGDGEFPLLQICKGEPFADIPNCVFKHDGNVTRTPFTYTKDETDSADIYLSHLGEIIFPLNTVPLGTFFIYTHLGCGLNCFYCGGCKEAQEITFGRRKVFHRPVEEVRKDIIAARPYTSTFQFDFDVYHKDLVRYCRKIWKDIDLSGHFCLLNSLRLPTALLIESAAKTFKYVYWDLDVLTLSEPHRERLSSKGMVKPQPTDEEIHAVLDLCDRYHNVEVRLNLINGLPYFTIEDIDIAGKFLTQIMDRHRSFSNLHWARLHAQPGAPVAADAEKYDMHSFAVHFEDFLEYSKKNVSNTSLTRLEHMNYPYVYFNDEALNSKLTFHYSETNKRIRQYRDNRRIDWTKGQALTFEQLNRKANQLSRLLREMGTVPDSIVGIILHPSIDLPLSILAVLKAGGGYLPIDPSVPAKRISTMLKDSQTSILISRENIVEETSFKGLMDFQVPRLKPHLTLTRPQIKDLDHLPFPDRSLVNYEKFNQFIGQALVKNVITLQATRGCPYKCAYCHKIWPKAHVFRSAENIFAELMTYYRIGVRRFAFIDDVFNLNRENSQRFFELIIKNQLDVQLFFPNGMRGDILTPDYIDLMVKAGTTSVALALETASPRLQKLIGKNIDLEKLRQILEYFAEKHPHVILELFTMHGFPTETEEETRMTLDFIKSIKWIHFPYVAILIIYPNTEMAKIALENGISAEAIERSGEQAANELPETLPFDRSVTLKYQAKILYEYFLSKERLRLVLPHQLKVMNKDEIVQKYNSYLPVEIESFDGLMEFLGISPEEIGVTDFVPKDYRKVPHLNRVLGELSPASQPHPDALNVLLLDLSQFFRGDSKKIYDVVETPLGLMYLMTNLKHRFGDKINGKIAKSRIDFDSLSELKTLLETFKPDVIGLRTLSLYKTFFHKVTKAIRLWGINVPVIAGGPYATTSYLTLLQDPGVDIVVLGEGEVTFSELIGKIIEKDGRLPDDEDLKNIPGIAFIPAAETKRSGTGAHELILLDTLEDILSEKHPGNPEPSAQPFHCAYTIYTSGTTGTPKGALLSHRNLVNFMHWFTMEAQITEQDKTMLTSSFAFDLGHTSLYPPLLKGGELHLLSRNIYLSPDKVLDYIDRKGITYLKITPSLLKTIVNHQGFTLRKCRSLRLAVVAGEPIDLDDIETARSLCCHLEIMNSYGPTETTVACVTKNIVFHAFDRYKMKTTIGKPIANANVYILDKDLNVMPVGVPGELCIAGAGVGRGYLNQPGLTAEKFIHFARDTEYVTLYKSGDLARWLPDGDIEFLGRIDSQVKIRGYRVEVEEIKTHLLKYSQLKEAYVLPRKDTDGNISLCAYIVPKKEPFEPQKEENETILSLSEVEEKIKSSAPLNTIPGMEEQVTLETIVGIFEKQVETFPGKIAFQSNGKTWTYDAVNNHANRIGRLIQEKYDDRYKLTDSEKIRYKRQMLLYGWSKAFQEKLKSTTVFVAGAGGGASPTIMQLALMGIGTIKICDFDDVELSNLNRQFLHDVERIGMNKAQSAQVLLERINPGVTVIPIKERLTRDNVFEMVGDADIIFDMMDGPADKFALSECAVVKRIPHVIIAMADLNGFASVLHTPHTPCYHCLFSKEKLDLITDGMKNYVENYSKSPLAVVAAPLLIGSGTAVNEVLKILMGVDEPAYNKFFYFNQRGANKHLRFTPSFKSMIHLFSDHFRKISREQGFDWDTGWRGNLMEMLDIQRDPECPLCGDKGKEKRNTLERRLNEQAIAVKPDQPPEKNSIDINNGLKPVGLLLDDRAEPVYKVASIMGALKSGKSYIPLDPTLNEDELSDIMDTSELRVILTDNKSVDIADKLRNKVNNRIPVINVDEIDEHIKEENLGENVETDDIAYVLFSPRFAGSNGSVSQTHREVLHFFTFCSRYSQDVSSRHLEISSLKHLAKLLDDRPSSLNPGDLEENSYSLSRLKENLSTELPQYMIPSYFVELEELPLTPNGKIDRKSLPVPETSTAPEEDSRPPNEEEVKLMRMWSEILEKEEGEIGIEQNFFELGGNSLNLILLVSKIHQEFGIEVPIAHLFANPTIKEIALWINSNNYSDSPVVLLNRPTDKKIFLFPPQIAYGVFYTSLASIMTDYSFYAFTFIEDEDILEQYIKLITTLQPDGPYIFLGYSAAGMLIFQVAKALEVRGYEVSDIIFFDCFFTEGKPLIVDEEFLVGHCEVMGKHMDRMGLSFLKEKVIKKSIKFMEYCSKIERLDKINANVHLILSEVARNSKTKNPRCWDTLTSKMSLNYNGHGTHQSILDPGNVEPNAEILRDILERIESERSVRKENAGDKIRPVDK